MAGDSITSCLLDLCIGCRIVQLDEKIASAKKPSSFGLADPSVTRSTVAGLAYHQVPARYFIFLLALLTMKLFSHFTKIFNEQMLS